MSTATKSKNIQSRVQTNIDSKIKDRAENVIKEVGLTPTAVINELQEAIKNVPVKKLRTKKEIEDFFNNEDWWNIYRHEKDRK